MSQLLPLRPHQERAIEGVKASLRSGHRRPIISLPTGAGKTLIATHIIHGALAKSKRVNFAVPMLNLVDQTFQRLIQNAVDPADIGVVQGDHEWKRLRAPVQIVSVQTAARRGWPEADLIIVDECHLQFDAVKKYIVDNPDKLFVGLSATPYSKGLGDHWDDLIIPTSIADLIEHGYLSKFRVFAPTHPDLSGVKIVAGDYHDGQLSERMSGAKIVADVVTTWLDKGDNQPTLCFAVDRGHAQLLHDQFASVGVTSAYVDANTDRDERARIIGAFQRGEVKVINSIGTMTTGVDVDCRCIIMARPTKSEILFVQCIGRGLRTAPGKEHCLARDTLVLTDRGEVKIQEITLDHKVWDGVRFVAHGGAVCNGVKPVMTYDGITATPDHEVMCNDWTTLAEAARRRLRIARSGIGRNPIRVLENNLTEDRRFGEQFVGRGAMRALRWLAHVAFPQYSEASEHGCLSALQRENAGDCAALVVREVPVAEGSLSKSEVGLLRSVRRSRDRVQICERERRGDLGGGEFGDSGSFDGIRQGGQSRTLRVWKFALGHVSGEHVKPTLQSWRERAVHFLSRLLSRSAICGQDADASDSFGYDGRANHRKVEIPFVQTEREVWDILSAGPLQRFTANGRLVHNCTILDHSDNHLRLGMVTDIYHDTLRTSKSEAAEKKERDKQDKAPTPFECVVCACLVPVRAPECPNCGYVPKRPNKVVCEDGELQELGAAPAKGKREPALVKLSRQGEQAIFSQLIAMQGTKREGWVRHKFRAIFDKWPSRNLVHRHEEPSNALRSWVRSENIKWAKSRESAPRGSADSAELAYAD